jgi:hypothetical protein
MTTISIISSDETRTHAAHTLPFELSVARAQNQRSLRVKRLTNILFHLIVCHRAQLRLICFSETVRGQSYEAVISLLQGIEPLQGA